MTTPTFSSIRALTAGRVSVLVSPRPLRILLACVIVLAAALVAAFLFGEPIVSIGRALDVVTDGGRTTDRVILLDYRANRTIVAALAGAALGLSGALMQTVTRNPLASPDILGITSGASLGAVAVITANGGPDVAPWTIPLGALIGGFATAAFIAAVSSGLDPLRLVLSGIALSALCSAAITFLLSYVDGDTAHAATAWMAGTLNGRGPEHIWPVLAGLVVAAVILLPQARSIGMLAMGRERAGTMGIAVESTERRLLLLSVVLATMATAATGPIGLVAFVAPQIVRRAAGTSSPPLVSSALGGAIVVVIADVAARTLIPWTAPIGAVTSLFGAPVLIYILWRTSRA